MASKTFRSVESGRGCAEFGPHHFVRTETVHEDGRVEWQVKGHDDNGYVNERGVRRVEMPLPLDLSRVAAARRSSGWQEVA